MDLARRCTYISNSYYNKGLKLAKENDLSKAAECLKNALKFNKRNTDARNLLGLIYFRIGEVADALVQWVLSLNLQPTDNAADRYLDDLQRTPGLIDSYAKAINDFNQTLALSQGGSDDLAILQLSKITNSYKNYLRPHLLLGLLCMSKGQNGKAYKNFQTVLSLDRGNELAQRCVEQLKSEQRASKGNRRRTNEKAEDAKEINEVKNIKYYKSGGYKETTFLSTAANILLGLIVGVAAILFIYNPIKEASAAREQNQQVVEISQELNEANSKIAEMERENSDLKVDYDALTNNSEMQGDEHTAQLSSFQQLAGAIKAFDNDDIKTCAELFSNIDSELIIDVEDGSSASVEHYYDQLKAYFDEIGYKELIKKGDELYAAGQYEDAIAYYDLSMTVHDNNPEALFRKAMCYLKQDKVSDATELFNEVINEYPDSEFAVKAKEERGY